MEQIQARLKALRNEMKQREIDVYIIPTSDFHETEYVGDHFKARAWMSNFSGSAGTLVVCHDSAALWTDGRYFIQAAKELEGTGIELMKMGVETTPPMAQYIYDHMSEGHALGFDGRVINTKLAEALKQKLADKHASLKCDEDLVGIIWSDRPALPQEPAFALDVKYCGKSSADKLNQARTWMNAHKIDAHIVTTLDDIAWYLNMRGNDIACYPVVLAYLIIEAKQAHLFTEESKLNDALKQQLMHDNVVLHPYAAVYDYVKTMNHTKHILLDKGCVNYRITSSLPKECEVRSQKNPSQLWKAIKNETELANNRIAHIKDGVAVTNFMYWLKNNIGKISIDEVSASDYLEECRKQQENFIEISFDTIAAYNENAAMMHYHATKEHCAKLEPNGFLLVDSGGQYFEGTTDITRTFVLGEISDEMRRHFTKVARGMMNLSRAKFLYGCTGINLDILARQPLWSEDIDYQCGTGHGVGFVLNVHEGPNGFRWKRVPEREDSEVLQEGMVTTIEPGVYLEGRYGIRTENELICRKGKKNEYGQFMEFETITFAPIDLDGIDVTLLSEEERTWLNVYHKEVYEKLSPYLSDEVKEWLKVYTRAI